MFIHLMSHTHFPVSNCELSLRCGSTVGVVCPPYFLSPNTIECCVPASCGVFWLECDIIYDSHTIRHWGRNGEG